jgi:lipid A 3-O-deacylase
MTATCVSRSSPAGVAARTHRFVAGYAIGAVLIVLQAVPPAQAEDASPGPRFVAGVMAHDRGPSSDNHENGIDLNGEVQFAPLDGAIGRAIGSPRPHLGVTPSLNGNTSALYGGLTYEFLPLPKWFVDGFFGLALHDGPLHKDPIPCAQRSDCGFGSRILPRLGLETGINLTRHDAVSLFYDHMSHGGLLNSENEGIDHVGVRYRYSF